MSLISDRKHYADARLLDRVVYVSCKPVDATDLSGNALIVADTMAYNPASKTAPATALAWAQDGYYRRTDETFVPEPTEMENREFSITIIDIDVRSEGGRAYKIIDDQNRRFDLREDQLLEIITLSGINKGGYVPGKFTWGILGSQMRLVIVGGALHTEMAASRAELKNAVERRTQGLAPTESKLKVGHVYEKRDKTIHAFVGRVMAPAAKKPAYAFIQLPVKPLKVVSHNSGYDPDPAWVKHNEWASSIVDKWDSMSWTERCQWDWFDQHKWYYERPGVVPYDRSEDIVLMASPKFEFEVADNAQLLVENVRNNVEGRHAYVNGVRDDLSEIHSLGRGVRRQTAPDYGHQYGTMTWEQRQARNAAAYEKSMQDMRDARRTFRDLLEWI